MNSELEAKVKALSVDGKIACTAALQLARELNLNPKEVGDMINKLKIKIAHCQLGCFP